MSPRILPTGKRPPRTRMSDFSFLVYGAPGIGKTTLANAFPDALFLATESGTELMEAASVPIGSWEDFLAVQAALRGREKHEFRTVVVDTIDLLYPLCLQATCQEMGISDPADAEWGRGWRTLKTRWINAIHGLRNLKTADGGRVCTIFLGHEKKAPIMVRRGKREVDTGRYYVSSDLPRTARGVLHSAVDFILHAEMDEEGNRLLRTQPADTPEALVEAKGRGTPDRRLPDTLPMEFKTLAREFSRAFNSPKGNRGENNG